MEQQAGMRTLYLNWQDVVSTMPEIEATWVPITYYKTGGRLEKLKFLPGIVRALLRARLQAEQGLGEVRYDSVLFNTYNPAVAYGKKLEEQRSFLMFDVTPVQYDSMAEWYERTPDNRGSWLANYKTGQIKRTFARAEGLIVWSKWAGDSAVCDYGADPKRVHVVPPGIDPLLWKPGLRADNGVTRILFTGGAFRRKGGDLLLRWARTTARKNWELHLVTYDDIGDLPAGVVMHRNAENNSPELIELAQSCHLFALPTRADCFSLASMEAMATEMPVITCDVGGIGDIVQDGETGYLIRPNDYDALHDRIDALIDDPDSRARMGKRGREVVCERFDATEQVKRGLEAMNS